MHSSKQTSNSRRVDSAYFVHPTSVVDEPCQIGAGTKIWHFCHIMQDAEIGERCSFGQGCFVASGVRIGNNVKVQNNVSFYEGVEVEDDVFCGPSMVFTNVMNPRAAVVRRDQYRRTVVRRGATIGANATIVCGIEIGQYAFVAAGAVVTRHVARFTLVAGVPGKQVGWMSRSGERLEFGADRRATCPLGGETYVLNDDGSVRLLAP